MNWTKVIAKSAACISGLFAAACVPVSALPSADQSDYVTLAGEDLRAIIVGKSLYFDGYSPSITSNTIGGILFCPDGTTGYSGRFFAFRNYRINDDQIEFFDDYNIYERARVRRNMQNELFYSTRRGGDWSSDIRIAHIEEDTCGAST